ncbi:MAG: hypothetical protein ACRCTR_07955 [Actinomycetota bacterium]
MESPPDHPESTRDALAGNKDLSSLDNGGLPEPKWTQEEGINREVAEDIFGDLIAYCSTRIHREEQNSHPDQTRIGDLEAERKQWVEKRRNLRHLDATGIKEVITIYGALVRERFHGSSDTNELAHSDARRSIKSEGSTNSGDAGG